MKIIRALIEGLKFVFLIIFVGWFFSPVRVEGEEFMFRRDVSRDIIDKLHICTLPDLYDRDSVRVSEDLYHIAFTLTGENGQKYLVVDGKQFGPFKKIATDSIIFSPDGKHVACHVESEGKKYWDLFLDGKILAGYEAGMSHPSFSPDGRVFYTAWKIKDKPIVIVGNQMFDQCDGIAVDSVVFSKKSKAFAFIATKDKKTFAVINGKIGKGYAEISSPIVLSPDGRRSAYTARTIDHKWVVVLDGDEIKGYTSVRGPVFSDDGKHFAFCATNDMGQCIVRDNIPGPFYDYFFSHLTSFSPDSQHLVYVGFKSGKQYVVVDGKPSQPYDVIKEILVSPDSRRICFEVFNIFLIKIHQGMVVCDGVEIPEKSYYDEFYPKRIYFSRNSEHLAFKARDGKKVFIVCDGKPSQSYLEENLWFSDGCFSPDSKYLGYKVREANGDMVIIDGTKGQKFDAILASPDDKRNALIFDSPRFFHYLAVKGKDVFLIKEKIDEL